MIRTAGDFETRTRVTQLSEGLRPGSLIRVFVPSADPFGRSLDFRSLRERVVDYVLTFTTGVTTSKGVGVWRRSDGVLLRERVEIVESYIREGMDAPTFGRFLSGLARIALAAGQEEWLVAVDGAPILLPGLPGIPASAPHGLERRNGDGR